MHPGPGRIRNDHSRPTLPDEKIFIADINQRTVKKTGMLNPIESRIFPGIVNSFGDHFHTYDPGRLAAQKYSDTAGPAIEIIHRLLPAQLRKLPGHLVQPLSLMGIGLEKRLGPYFKLKVLQLLYYIPFPKNYPGIQVR